MRNLTAIVILAFALGALFIETESAGIEDLDIAQDAMKGIQEAKGKLGALDTKIVKIAEAIGPEGQKAYGALKSGATSALKKGFSWLKNKFHLGGAEAQ